MNIKIGYFFLYYIRFHILQQQQTKAKESRQAQLTNHMLTIYNFFLIVSLVLIANTKRISKTITMAELSEKQTIFLTRFDFGIGEGNITIKHRKKAVDNSQFESIKVGLLLDENYQKFKNEQNCTQKQMLYHQTHRIRFFDSVHGTQIVRVQQAVRQHLWFIYIYTCQPVTLSTPDGSEGIFFESTLINNGSHLGEDESLLWPFVLQFALWFAIIVKYLFKPFTKALVQNNLEMSHMLLYTGYALIGLGLFYKIINLVTVYSSGQSIVIFDILHGAIKALSEGIILGLIIAVAWGWQLTHIQYEMKQLLFPIAVTILNIVCIIIWHMTEDIEQTYHQYQQPAGILVFVIRVIICCIFLVGCLKINAKSVGKRKYFIIKYAKYGFIYLMGWPVAVIFCEIFLPDYLHNQVIVITEQYVHLIMNAYICWLFIYPESEYKKVNMNEDNGGLLPEYRKKITK